LAQHRLLEALRTVGRHAALDPETGRDRELVSVIVAGLQGGPDTVEAAVALVEKDLGEAGVELLYDLTTKQTQVRWKSKVNQSLTKPEVLAKATPATRAALELRSAKTCAARAALLPRIKRDGGERALVLLKAMEPQQGCGFLGLSDCWSCLRQSTALPDAVAAIEARLPRK
jgi:serine/threonine-protein kinase